MRILYTDEEKDRCTGCTACVAICPKSAINMCENEKGFLYPSIEEELCVNCGLCKKVCPIDSILSRNDETYPRVYAVKHKNDEVRKKSSSGGTFTAISDYVLEKGGVIYGCVYDENMVAKHIRIDNRVERNKCCGSKYVQSNLSNGEIFLCVKNDLDNRILVLFSGTPCQIDGLLNYLGRNYQNLITLDLVCRGVPSPKLFREHIDILEKRMNSTVSKYVNRSKMVKWGTHIELVGFENGYEEYKSTLSQAWKRIFHMHCALRDSCYECKYVSINRVADITIADFWGIEKSVPEFKDDLGVSLVLINNHKIEQYKMEMFEDTELMEIRDKYYIQPALKSPLEYPEKYDDFWDLYKKKGYSGVIKKYANCSFVGEIKEIVKKIIYKRNYIP